MLGIFIYNPGKLGMREFLLELTYFWANGDQTLLIMVVHLFNLLSKLLSIGLDVFR